MFALAAETEEKTKIRMILSIQEPSGTRQEEKANMLSGRGAYDRCTLASFSSRGCSRVPAICRWRDLVHPSPPPSPPPPPRCSPRDVLQHHHHLISPAIRRSCHFTFTEQDLFICYYQDPKSSRAQSSLLLLVQYRGHTSYQSRTW